MSRHLLVRADASNHIGLGHVLRTMAVADELARTGTRITFACQALSPWVATQLAGRGFAIHMLGLPDGASQIEDAKATCKTAQQCGVDAVLLDHYDLTFDWCDHVKSNTSLFIAAFDDLARDARRIDLLIDASPGRQASDYAPLIPEGVPCLVGAHYAPLRSEFGLACPAAEKDCTPLVRLAISMGGVDPEGITLTCLDGLDGCKEIELTVVLSSDAKHLNAIKSRVARMTTPTRLLLDRTDMAAVLSEIDLVIGAGGTSALERCALGVPSVLAVLAENQEFNAAHLFELGAAMVLPSLTIEAVRSCVTPLLVDLDKRKTMGRKAAQLCDGLGAPRIAAALIEQVATVQLAPVRFEDKEVIFKWQNEPRARQFSRNPDPPTLDGHAAWFSKRLMRIETEPFYIIKVDGTPSGFVRLDATPTAGRVEVSVLVAQSSQGRSVGHWALGLLRVAHPKQTLVAEVDLRNTASQTLFAGAGYERTSNTTFVSRGWLEIVRGQTYED